MQRACQMFVDMACATGDAQIGPFHPDTRPLAEGYGKVNEDCVLRAYALLIRVRRGFQQMMKPLKQP